MCGPGLTVFGGSLSARLLGAAVLGFFWQQIAFVGHDIGHNSITHRRSVDYMLGAVNVALFGVSMGWWKRSHNTHHVVCNSVENDPDIQHLPVLAVTPSIFKGFVSTYHAKGFAPLVLDPIAHFIVRCLSLSLSLSLSVCVCVCLCVCVCVCVCVCA
eukprot:COSAG03_NODE_1733_length_3586_cov_630.263550_3_plen_157_part_00